MARSLYCYRCDIGDKKSVHDETLNGVPDLHFVSKSNPQWESFEWTSLFFMPNALVALAERVIERKKQEFGEIPPDLEVHQCDKGGGILQPVEFVESTNLH